MDATALPRLKRELVQPERSDAEVAAQGEKTLPQLPVDRRRLRPRLHARRIITTTLDDHHHALRIAARRGVAVIVAARLIVQVGEPRAGKPVRTALPEQA